MKGYLLLLLLCSPSLAQSTPSPPPQNWKSLHYADLSKSPYANGSWIVTPTTTQIAFSFTLPADQRQTSAAVYNSAATLIRTLWSNRAYNAGTYGDIWDGLDDYGNAATGGPFTIKVAYNNVQYDWDGPLFTTDSNWYGPNSWTTSSVSFTADMTFLNGRGYRANGYGEVGQIMASSFDETDPNGPLYPLLRYVNSNNIGQEPTFIQTDGTYIYLLLQGFGPQTKYHEGVYAFSPNGQPKNFPGAVLTTRNEWVDQTSCCPPSPQVWAGLRVIDGSQLPGAAITGFAVQHGPSAAYIATAHGQYMPPGTTGATTPSLDQVWLFDKTSGAQAGMIGVPNPQDMAFDLNGNLWIVSGNGTGDVLYEVTGVGSANKVTTPIPELSNPMWVTVSPTNGDIFVIDGGNNQQIYEYSALSYKKVSTLGKLAGYGQGASCNANVDPLGHDIPTFQFDGFNLHYAHFAGQLGLRPSASWVSIDDHGDMWVGDYVNFRVLHYTYSGGTWHYVNRIISSAWQYYTGILRADPTRVWGGFMGLEEFKINYNQPLQMGDPEATGGNGAWIGPIRNWAACIFQAGLDSGHPPQLNDVQTLPNGHTVGLVANLNNRMFAVTMDPAGTVKYSTPATITSQMIYGPDGSFYGISSSGTATKKAFTFRQYPINSYDFNNLPVWSTTGSMIGSYTADHIAGQPFAASILSAYWPSSNNIFPVFDTAYNANATGASFHIGGLAVHGTELQWMSRRQKVMQFNDGEGSYPGTDTTGRAQGGIVAWTMPGTPDMFMFDSYNGQNWSCNFYHYRDDGLFLGQFGWQGSGGYGPQNLSSGTNGHPFGTSLTGKPLVPAVCDDSVFVHAAAFHNDYYILIGDEGYYHGIHRFHVSNLSSVHEVSGSGSMGSTLKLVLVQ